MARATARRRWTSSLSFPLTITTPGEYTIVVPAGKSSVTFDIAGADAANNNVVFGGKGGRVQGTLPVTAGQILTLYVGRQPAFNSTGLGGAPGGGNSPTPGPDFGGGGYSAIFRAGTAMAIAGGGGGGSNASPFTGGAGGGTTGGAGPAGLSSANGGGGGTQSAGGSAGTGTTNNGTAGTSLQGGNGGSGSGGGSGGGGGYFGGGGGGASTGGYGGGGGGSSYTDASVTGVTHTQGFQSGNGYVTLS